MYYANQNIDYWVHSILSIEIKYRMNSIALQRIIYTQVFCLSALSF